VLRHGNIARATFVHLMCVSMLTLMHFRHDGSKGRAPGARPETANAEHQRPTPAVDDVADVGASSENACSICGYRRRFGDDGHSFGSCEANVREYTASQNVPGPLRSQICTCSAAKAKGCTLNAQ